MQQVAPVVIHNDLARWLAQAVHEHLIRRPGLQTRGTGTGQKQRVLPVAAQPHQALARTHLGWLSHCWRHLAATKGSRSAPHGGGICIPPRHARPAWAWCFPAQRLRSTGRTTLRHRWPWRDAFYTPCTTKTRPQTRRGRRRLQQAKTASCPFLSRSEPQAMPWYQFLSQVPVFVTAVTKTGTNLGNAP